MMSDSQIKKISLTVVVAGLLLIFIAAALAGPRVMNIAAITDEDVGRQISVNGSILSYNTKDGHVFLTVTDGTGNIIVVMFERTARGAPDVYQLKRHDNVTVSGQVNIYKSELEIIANSITRVE